MTNALSTSQLLKWYVEAGIDETIGDEALNRYAIAKTSQPAPAAPPKTAAKDHVSKDFAPEYLAQNTEKSLSEACKLAGDAKTMEELCQAVKEFDGCALKKTATNLVFGDGDIKADVMLIGEAPGTDEDRQGMPFAGSGGKLLDGMLESIDLERTKVFITNTVFWRPPGNRNPTSGEIAVCMPFVERMVELVDPEILIIFGGAAAKSMLAQTSNISRLRGNWFSYATPRLARPIPTTATFHPEYLLNTPAQKRETWSDLRAIRRKLQSLESTQK